MRITRHPLAACPTCRRPIDAATSVTTDACPEPGDFSVCVTCGEILRYREDLTVRKCEAPELDDPGLPQHERAVIERVSRAVRSRWLARLGETP